MKARKKLVEIALFLIKLNLFSALLVFLQIFQLPVLILTKATFLLTFFLTSILGLKAIANNSTLILRDFTIVIDEDCSGWKALVFFLALIFSTPRRKIKERLTFLFLGSLSLFFFNILRIIVCILVLLKFPQSFLLLHDILWRESMIFLTLLLWIVFLYKGRLKNIISSPLVIIRWNSARRAGRKGK